MFLSYFDNTKYVIYYQIVGGEKSNTKLSVKILF